MKNKAQEIVDEINKRNIELYGPICPVCSIFESLCRCASYRSKYDENDKPRDIPLSNEG